MKKEVTSQPIAWKIAVSIDFVSFYSIASSADILEIGSIGGRHA